MSSRTETTLHTSSPPINPSYETEPEIVYAESVTTPPTVNSSDPDRNTNDAIATNSHTRRELGGAAVAGGLVGLVVGGPILGAVAAGGCSLAATSKSQAGNVARAGGEAVASVGDRLKKIDKKHRVVEKTGKGITKGCKWVAKKVKPRDHPARPTSNAGAPVVY